ncbi:MULTISPECIES: DUF899 family protein [Micromonospora]|uniref:DUF899 family protein n=1 Tax=Micromonospora TaxID=1873 RepID=UPI000D14A650|nr:DUF899 family protein [Micromonospora sp. MH33]PSK65889.1 hypothetical protein B0E53_02142 [Micromonospora sp. MH33]
MSTSTYRTALPPIVDRETWLRERDHLLAREKAHTREGDAIAAARRRLPMTPVPPVTVQGPGGETPLLEVFEGRRMLMAYFHMWHDGKPYEDQCEGCTFATCHMGMLDYLHARDVTYAVFCQGSYADSAPFAEFMGYRFPWYSARDSDPALVDGRGFGFIACYLRDDDDRIYETYWTTGRGVEALTTSYHALDLTVYGRQENWEDSPEGWPTVSGHQWRLDGRPIAQWSRPGVTTATGESCCGK